MWRSSALWMDFGVVWTTTSTSSSPLWTLKDYVNFTLWVEGSTLTADEVDVVGDINVQPHLADVSQHDPEPSQPSPRFAEHEPEPTVDGEPEPSVTDEPSPSGATELRIAQEPEPILSHHVREPATEPMTVNVPDGREGAGDSTAHCTAAEGEQCLDLGLLALEQDSTDFFGDVDEDMPALQPSSKLPECLDFPPTFPLLSPSIVSAASVPPPLSPGSPSAHPQPASQSPSVSWLEDPSSLPPASRTPLWTSGSPPLPRSPEPWPSRSSVSPRIIGSPSPPRAPPPPAPPPSVGPLELSALPPPWLLPPLAPPWATIMAAAWVSLGSSCSGSLLSPPWLLPPSDPPWTLLSHPWLLPPSSPPRTLFFCPPPGSPSST
ncbi:Myosin-1 [Labeo rohita]|uniref:Myosin-1 n=1 Tax=Labeo rohita TaxID=84645 RepID=A0ABQ8LB87_LABRO|nr:Myosin-1 [Labeo rohita]